MRDRAQPGKEAVKIPLEVAAPAGADPHHAISAKGRCGRQDRSLKDHFTVFHLGHAPGQGRSGISERQGAYAKPPRRGHGRPLLLGRPWAEGTPVAAASRSAANEPGVPRHLPERTRSPVIIDNRPALQDRPRPRRGWKTPPPIARRERVERYGLPPRSTSRARRKCASPANPRRHKGHGPRRARKCSQRRNARG